MSSLPPDTPLKRTTRGRVLTPAAYHYLGQKPPPSLHEKDLFEDPDDETEV